MDRYTPAGKNKPLVLLCQHFYPELHSTGLLLSQLAVGLVARGYPLRVYCAQPTYWEMEHKGEAPSRDTYNGVDIVRFSMAGNPRGGLFSRAVSAFSFFWATFWSTWRVRNEITGVIITTNPPFLGLVAVILKYTSNLDYVTIIHDVYPDIVVRLGFMKPNSPIVWLWEKISRLIITKSSSVIVLGQDMKKVIQKKDKSGHKAKIEVITNWADESLIKPIPKAENLFVSEHDLSKRFVIQYSGRMGRTHNLEPLIQAAEILSSEPLILFQFIGDGAKLKILQQMVGEKQLTNVQFLPYQPLDNLPSVLSGANICVVCLGKSFTGLSVPSKTYGILASGRPVLGFLDPQSEIGQTVLRHQCGIVLENPNGEQVASMIRQLMHSQSLLHKMGENGRKAFLENYTLGEAIDRHVKIFQRVFYPSIEE